MPHITNTCPIDSRLRILSTQERVREDLIEGLDHVGNFYTIRKLEFNPGIVEGENRIRRESNFPS